MTRRQFRWLLVSNLLLGIIALVVHASTQSLIPETVRTEHSALFGRIAPQYLDIVIAASLGCLILLIIVLLIGLVGMFFFWKPSRFFFLAIVLVSILFYPVLYPWYVDTAWDRLLTAFGDVFDGVLLALIFFGPAKPLFTPARKLT